MITPLEDFSSKNVFYFPFRELHFSKDACMIKIVMLPDTPSLEFNTDYQLTFVLKTLEPKRKNEKYFVLNHIDFPYTFTSSLSI